MKLKSLCLLLLLLGTASLAPAATVTVTTIDNDSDIGDGQTSLMEALLLVADGDTIAFNIPGAGPHVIVTPLGGYPLITVNNLTIDGYTQAGATPNTNPILGGNNALLKIVLDSTGTDSGVADPADPSLNSRRSTRILHSGYGDSENGILAVFAANNFTVRGISFLGRHTVGSTDDPSIYAVALVNAAKDARIQGCWFGLPPGGHTMADLKPMSAAVAAFRYRTGGDVYSEGCIVGTDGDGTNDRAEFNIIVGGHIPLALELPRARISGNYVNVFPDGKTFVDVDAIHQMLLDTGREEGDSSVENMENGRITDGSVVGTNGDGVSDSDERNIFGHAVYEHEMEVYSSAVNLVVAGNYFGVGVDGVTRAPVPTNAAPDFADLGGNASVRVGSNGDGVSDDLEGNTIVGSAGSRFVVAGWSTPIVCRGNAVVDCGFKALPFADGDNGSYPAYYANYLASSFDGVTPAITRYTNGVLRGTVPAPSAGYPNVTIDLYVVDPKGLENTNYWPVPLVHPAGWLASYVENGPSDLDPAPNAFAFEIRFPLSAGAFLAVAANYSQVASTETTNAVTSPLSNPVTARPALAIVPTVTDVGPGVQVSWLGPDNMFDLELNNVDIHSEAAWFAPFDANYTAGRNIVVVPGDLGDAVFFRLKSTP